MVVGFITTYAISMGSYMVIFEARVLGEIIVFG
jgi:hypothetical protein